MWVPCQIWEHPFSCFWIQAGFKSGLNLELLPLLAPLSTAFSHVLSLSLPLCSRLFSLSSINPSLLSISTNSSSIKTLEEHPTTTVKNNCYHPWRIVNHSVQQTYHPHIKTHSHRDPTSKSLSHPIPGINNPNSGKKKKKSSANTLKFEYGNNIWLWLKTHAHRPLWTRIYFWFHVHACLFLSGTMATLSSLFFFLSLWSIRSFFFNILFLKSKKGKTIFRRLFLNLCDWSVSIT